MKILLHTCCGPCAIFPVNFLRQQGFEVSLYFFNPNIHPFMEFRKRIESLKLFAEKNILESFIDDRYQLTDFLRAIVFNETKRCSLCQSMRIDETVTFAKKHDFEYFTSSLLYSRYQNHDEIKGQCEDISKGSGVQFVYYDFREGWRSGIESAISQGLYRQAYCGCIYSEQERYDKTMRTKRKKNNVENDSPGDKQQK
jgi:hypothetical protein